MHIVSHLKKMFQKLLPKITNFFVQISDWMIVFPRVWGCEAKQNVRHDKMKVQPASCETVKREKQQVQIH